MADEFKAAPAGESPAQIEERRILNRIKEQETYATIDQVVDRIAALEAAKAMGEVRKDHASVTIIGLKLEYLRWQQNKLLGIGTKPSAVAEQPPTEEVPAEAVADTEPIPEEASTEPTPETDGDQDEGVPHPTLRLDDVGLLTGRQAGLLEDAGVVLWGDLLELFAGKDSRKTALCSVQGIGRATADDILKKLKDVLPSE